MRNNWPDDSDSDKCSKEISEKIKDAGIEKVNWAILLGSGQDAFTGEWKPEVAEIDMGDYIDMERFPKVDNNECKIKLYLIGKREIPVLVCEGKLHLYQGAELKSILLPIVSIAKSGISKVIISSTAVAINPFYCEGEIICIRDAINLTGTNPMIGMSDENGMQVFSVQEKIFNDEITHEIKQPGRLAGVPVDEGVYASTIGPVSGSSSEMTFLRLIGADVVGNSVINEAIAASYMGMKTGAVAVVGALWDFKGSRTANREIMMDNIRKTAPYASSFMESIICGEPVERLYEIGNAIRSETENLLGGQTGVALGNHDNFNLFDLPFGNKGFS